MMLALFASMLAMRNSRSLGQPEPKCENDAVAHGHMVRRTLIALAIVGTVSACSDAKPETTGVTVCAANIVSAVAVEVRDARTGNPAAAGGVLYGRHQVGSAVVTDSSSGVESGLTI